MSAITYNDITEGKHKKVVHESPQLGESLALNRPRKNLEAVLDVIGCHHTGKLWTGVGAKEEVGGKLVQGDVRRWTDLDVDEAESGDKVGGTAVGAGEGGGRHAVSPGFESIPIRFAGF
jgi:hypothetical protein